MEPLNGKVVVVTGAASGIGAAIAKVLAAHGATVALAARRAERLQEVRSAIEDTGGQALAIPTDVTQRDQVKRLIQQVENQIGPVDVLVNNAGVMPLSLMKNLHEDEWDRMIDVNIRGVLNGIGAVLPGMLNRGRGDIINISSDAGRKLFPGSAVYSATKWAVEAITQGLRMETAGSGLRVTSIQPGAVATELAAQTTDKEALKGGEILAKMRILDPEDVARAVLYVVSQPPHVSINEILIRPSEQGS